MRNSQPINIEKLLSHVPLFEGLDTEEIARIAQHTREIQAAKGDVLFHAGDPCAGCHLVVYGQIKLAFTSSTGNEKIVEIIQQGQSFGEAVMLMEKPYIVFAQALSDSLLLHISKTAIFEELERDHRVARKMLAGMAKRLHQLMTDVEGYSLHSGTERIIAYLLREITERQLESNDVIIELSVTKGVIASRLNLTQEHFSRILHELSDQSLIAVDGKRIRIPNVARLQKHLN